MDNILLIGGGGHCRSVIDVIEQEKKYRIAGIIDLEEKVGEKVYSYPILGSDATLAEYQKTIPNALITVGHILDNSKRVELFQKTHDLGYNLPNIISPLAYVSKHAKLGQGIVVMHHAIVNAGASIDDNTILNTRALVEHDASIGKHCHISTGTIINGGTQVEDNSFIGSQSTTKEYVQISGFHKAGQVIK